MSVLETSNQRHYLPWQARPLSELVRIAWPLVISLLSFSLMTLVDTLFIGRLGAVELAAAGVGGTSVFTVVSFGLAVLAAAKVKVGESHGASDSKAVERSLGAFLRLALVLGVLSIILAQLLALALPLLTAHEQTGQLARQYTAIRSSGFLFVLIGTAIGQWLQAQGDSKSSMRAALFANVVNIPLNALLIFGMGWGLAGAALASAGSRIFEMVWLVYAQKFRSIELKGGGRTRRGFHWTSATWKDSWDAFLVGLPTGLERVLDMMAFTAVPLLLSQIGPEEVAAHQIVLQIMLLSFLPGFALSESVSVLIAQAIGAGHLRLVGRLTVLGLALSFGYASFCSLACLFFNEEMVNIFTQDAGVIASASATLLVGALLQLINSGYNLLKGVLRGLSIFRFVAWVTIGCAWVITVPLTYFLAVHLQMGVVGAWWTLCVEVSIGLLILAWRIKMHPIFRSTNCSSSMRSTL